MPTLTFTDLLRTPKDVAARAQNGAVRITRQGSADLVLVSAEDFDRQREGVALAGSLVRACLEQAGDMGKALVGRYSWAGLFDAAELTQFAAEMDRLVWAAAETGHYSGLLRAFARWRGTAEVYADGFAPSDAESLEWIDPPIDVPKPPA